MMTFPPHFAPRALRALATTAALGLAVWPGATAAGEVADTVSQLASNRMITREVSLKDLGIREPIILNASDARREIFFPVPPGVSVLDAGLQLDAHYLRGEGGRTTFVLSLDGYPVSSRSFTQPEGSADLAIGVDGAPRSAGFVRVGAAWASVVSERACTSERTSGNILRIAPTTRLHYRYDATEIRDLSMAWASLPSSVTIAVAGQTMAKDSYDAAWRIGVALERVGKRAVVRALPSPGDEVDLAGIVVPDALRAIPAFKSLVGAERLKISGPAEVGALLVLGAAPVQAQVAIVDQDFRSKMDAALTALAQQVDVAAPDAKAALAKWRSGAMSVANEPLESGAVRLMQLAGQPLIAIAPDAGAKAAGLFDDLWRRLAVSRSVVIRNANDGSGDASAVSLARLGGTAMSFDVLERGDWSATFDLGALASDGRVPSRLELDVSAAPGATTTQPVASVFINDMLLGAKRLDANGQPERVAVEVPSYALKPQNVLRVSFQRQSAGEHCRETPQAYPVAILPTSRLLLEQAPAADDFAGVIPRLAGPAAMIVPEGWLTKAPETLAVAIRLANASGLSPVRASFTASPGPVKPDRPFLSLDVPLEGMPAKVKVEGDRLIIAGRDSTNLLDVTGLDGLGAISVVRTDGQPGLVYGTVGRLPPALEAPFSFTGGDIAVLGPSGVLAQIDTRDPFGNRRARDDRKTWFQELWGKVAWGGSAAASGLLLLIVLRARQVRRRHSGSDH
ncbi:cellulose biosynthesis cyclic di-GMP-binding regulatory protein BcsB [Microvirga rosea]|uniref:cellulose biosynthesis cyclic di-GMP-binding regulatory protein BcsB n=1 Tax=Microvirga rosea TaxID=2715425 RepID=UPI001D0BAAA3|nr:cellulose biosynthesis cyclic di-GMP-binding regulatory protein BcsB [Microvirga rosea]MCB8822797.1 cellulose biosynthesis cyclic di-GMP-binding regulatory protein BcsB [Microvirga rosea]